MRLFARIPLESTKTVFAFAAMRAAITAIALAGALAFDVPHRGRLVTITAIGFAWAMGALYMTPRSSRFALSPMLAVVDVTLVGIALALVPQAYPATAFLTIFLVAGHAHFQGDRRGFAIGIYATALIVPLAALVHTGIAGALLAFFECLFAGCTLGAGLLMGRLRTEESAGRVRARELSRRVLEAEGEVRRRVAEAIHDGPVQELASLDMMLSTVRTLLERGELDRAQQMLAEAQSLVERNIGTLREEIVGLGPYGLEQITLDAAIEQCADAWRRRFAMEITLELARLDLPNDICGGMFGIVQEAVTNAGRHSGAKNVWVTVNAVDHTVEARVRDDGSGFGDEEPLGANEPGHIGLASMRERAELMGGSLEIDTGPGGSTVLARVPVPEDPQPDDAPARGGGKISPRY